MTPSSVAEPGASVLLVPGPHVHFAVYDGEVVALDTRTDRYFGVGLLASRAVMWALAPDSSPRPADADAILAPLVDRGFLVPAERGAAPLHLSEPPVGGGLSCRAWHPDQSVYLNSADGPGMHDVVAAYARLRQADRVLRRDGMAALLRVLRRHCPADPCETACLPGSAGPGRLMRAHISARMIYPHRIECLPCSAALALDAWHRGLPARFVIGVQKYPFHAHAWVELGGVVVNDAQEVRERLASIVTIPGLTDAKTESLGRQYGYTDGLLGHRE